MVRMLRAAQMSRVGDLPFQALEEWYARTKGCSWTALAKVESFGKFSERYVCA